MPEGPLSVPRSVARLAAGVLRPRLVDPILSARPPMVVISAPSGYGKSVLAAQVACSAAFEDVVWVRCGGDVGSVSEAMGQVARQLRAAAGRTGECPEPDAAVGCAVELTALPDDAQLLCVFDDAGWVDDAEACSLLAATFSEAPSGCVVVLTSRAAASMRLDTSTWTVNAAALLLSDEELSAAWRLVSGSELDADRISTVARDSGRHAALVSLMARESVFGNSAAEPMVSGVAQLIRRLSDEQLNSEERLILDCAALLRDESTATLARCGVGSGIQVALRRAAAVLPLVSITPDRVESQRFEVHDLVSAARCSAQQMALVRPDVLTSIIEQLESNGRPNRALEVAIESGLAAGVVECLARSGERLLLEYGDSLVLRGLAVIPRERLAVDSGLLLLSAEVSQTRGLVDEACAQAALAKEIAELSGDPDVASHAAVLVGQIRMAAADYQGSLDAVRSIAPTSRMNSTDRARASTFEVVCLAAVGDLEQLRSARAAAELTIRSSAAPAGLPDRLATWLALSYVLRDGDYASAMRLLLETRARQRVQSEMAVVSWGNLVALAIQCGDLELADHGIDEAMLCAESEESPNLRDITVERAVVLALGDDAVGVDSSVASLLMDVARRGEWFTVATGCTHDGRVYLASRDWTEFARIADLGVSVATSHLSSPPLLWQAEMVRALAHLGQGDIARAVGSAELILPLAEESGVGTAALDAHFILATAAIRRGDLESAVRHVASQTEHILRCQPNMIVACALRAFPELMGPLCLAIGIEAIPARILNMVPGKYAAAALEQAATVLTPDELKRLTTRMRLEAQKALEPQPLPDVGNLHVRLLGGLEVQAPHGEVTPRDWGKRKARLLFMMLVAKQGTEINRSELIDYLWPEFDEERGISNFYVIWSAMKRAVSPGGIGETRSPYFENTNGVCRIIGSKVVTDLDEFEDARARARDARAARDVPTELAALREAIAIYRGDVLPGDIYDDWFGGIRQRFRQEFQDCVIRLADVAAEQGRPLDALPTVIDAGLRDPLREDLYQARMRLEIASGQRAAAIETYLACRSRLVDELGIDPSSDTVDLYNQVLGMEETRAWDEKN